MKVVPPSFEIMTHLDGQSMATRIEACGRICYKSEEKITAESAEPFVKNILKRRHNSVAEMAVLTIRIAYDQESWVSQLFEAVPKFFSIDRVEKKTLLMTGSVRAFRELYQDHGTLKLVKAISAFLGERHPLFYFDLVPKRGWLPQSGIEIVKVPLAEVDTLPGDLLARHRHVAVKFIVNRAVTHEIVRHRPCSFLQESQRYCRYDKDQFGNEVTFIRSMFYEEGTPEYGLWKKAMEETEAIYMKLLETSSPQAARTVLPNSCRTELIVFANLLQWMHMFRLRTSPAAEPSMREVMIPLLERFKEKYPSIFAPIVTD